MVHSFCSSFVQCSRTVAWSLFTLCTTVQQLNSFLNNSTSPMFVRLSKKYTLFTPPKSSQVRLGYMRIAKVVGIFHCTTIIRLTLASSVGVDAWSLIFAYRNCIQPLSFCPSPTQPMPRVGCKMVLKKTFESAVNEIDD